MTPQEIFDTAWKGITKQGQPAISPAEGHCSYLTSTGTRCAAGQLMNDDEIAAYGDESGNIHHILMVDSERGDDKILRPFFAEHVALIQKIQWAHDNKSASGARFVSAFHREMEFIAKEYRLKVPE